MVKQTGTQDIADLQDENGSIMKIKDSGYVGIGTTSPTEKLDVSGNIKATNFIGNGSSLIGVPMATDASGNALVTNNVLKVLGGNSASCILNANNYSKSLYVGTMGTNHCDANNAQFKLDKSLGHICIDPVVGGTTTLNLYAGISSIIW